VTALVERGHLHLRASADVTPIFADLPTRFICVDPPSQRNPRSDLDAVEQNAIPYQMIGAMLL
jgi:hypothetical protein